MISPYRTIRESPRAILIYMKRVVTIGGGTGTFTVLSGLKKHAVDLTAIVTVADSGGSTGRLRDEFGQLPVGDLRMALVALAEEENGHQLLRELFLYRFSKGNGLEGHNFGNLFLTAMTDILGSEEQAIEFASRVLRINGRVLPVTTHHVQLHATYEDGSTVTGEAIIDEPPEEHNGEQAITSLAIVPTEATITPEAAAAIMDADMVVLGPGDLYTSVLANIVIDGVASTLSHTRATLVYVSNLMTKYGQTHGFSVTDHVREVERYVGRAMDHVVVNNAPLPPSIRTKYEAEGEFVVADDAQDLLSVLYADVLADEEVAIAEGDTLKRSYIRHDSDKLAQELITLIVP